MVNIVFHENKTYDSPECLIIWGNRTCGNIIGSYCAGHLVGRGRLPEVSLLSVALLGGLLLGDLQDWRLQ